MSKGHADEREYEPEVQPEDKLKSYLYHFYSNSEFYLYISGALRTPALFFFLSRVRMVVTSNKVGI